MESTKIGKEHGKDYLLWQHLYTKHVIKAVIRISFTLE